MYLTVPCFAYNNFDYCLVSRHLLVNPKERRVVVVESILSATTRFRNILANVFFRHFEVIGIKWVFASSVIDL